MNTDNGIDKIRLVCLVLVALGVSASSASAEQLTIEIKDYAAMPMTGAVDGTTNIALLARLNSMREEPGGTNRFFVVDNEDFFHLPVANSLKVSGLKMTGSGLRRRSTQCLKAEQG